jgi:hypothetical protein
MRWPETDEELWWFVRACWGYQIPLQAVCPNHVAPFKAFADAFFARHELIVWKGSRGFGGKTTLLGLLALTEQVCLGANVTLLGGSGVQSERVHETMAEAWQYPSAPRRLLRRSPTVTRTRLTNGSTAIALTASQRSVRGPHPQRLRLDEIDEMDWEIYQAALGQPLSTPGIPSQVVASSTYHNPRGTMYRVMEHAKEAGYPCFSWCYKETSLPPFGWLDASEIAKARQRLSARKDEEE